MRRFLKGWRFVRPLYSAQRPRSALACLGSAVLCLYACGNTLVNETSDETQCPGGVIGDVTAAPEITIVEASDALGDIFVRGVASNVDAGRARVVLWAKTDIWYVQPFTDQPFTTICSDGTWRNAMHPWDRAVALLVDESYAAGSTRFTHPSEDLGVLSWDEWPEPRPDRTLEFSGYTWHVKRADVPAGPGPNYFWDSEDDVRVDGGDLHLTVNQRDGRWYSTEVFLDRPLGHGVYTFGTTTDMTSLGDHTVAAGFLYETTDREIDVEFSKALIATPDVGQYVVQPYARPGNLRLFPMLDGATTHRIEWREDRIEFTSWNGLGDAPPDSALFIDHWVYTGSDIPPPGDERFRFNVWLFDGIPPATGVGDAFAVRFFRHEP